MRVKYSLLAQSIDKTDGLKPGEGTASQEPSGAGSSPSSYGQFYPFAHSSPVISVVNFLFLGLGHIPSVSAAFPSFFVLPCSKSNSCLSLPSSLLPSCHLYIFSLFPIVLLLSPFCCHSIFLSPYLSLSLPPFPLRLCLILHLG